MMAINLIQKLLLSKKISKGTTELDRALDGILALEGRRDAAKKALDDAKARLQAAMAGDLLSDSEPTDHEKETNAVIAAQTRFDAAEKLLADAKQEVYRLIVSCREEQRKTLVLLESKTQELRHDIDARKAKLFAEFAKSHNVQLIWSSNNYNHGTITVPPFKLEREELEEIEKAAENTSPHIDQDQIEFDMTFDSREKINIITHTADVAIILINLLEWRRRGQWISPDLSDYKPKPKKPPTVKKITRRNDRMMEPGERILF